MRYAMCLAVAVLVFVAGANGSHASAPGAAMPAFSRPAPDIARSYAMRFRPHLFFDSAERWRPQRIAALLSERFAGGSAHRLCGIGSACTRVRHMRALAPASLPAGAQPYLDVHGAAAAGGDVGAPAASCPRPRPPRHRLDCGRGSASAMYYDVVFAGGRFYIGYWWFFRYNRFDRLSGAINPCRGGRCFDHEGDWEGVTAITTPAAPYDLESVAYAQHDGVYRHAVAELSGGEHPAVYVSKGTHASYPRACTGLDCRQVTRLFGQALPEGRSNGKAPWERNDARRCAQPPGCLLPFPAAGSALDWNGFPGRWGSRTCRRRGGATCRLAIAPRSPGMQFRFLYPWCFTGGATPIACDPGPVASNPPAPPPA